MNIRNRQMKIRGIVLMLHEIYIYEALTTPDKFRDAQHSIHT